MLADIGLIIAAYVIFRGVQTLLQMAPGGPLANLHSAAQVGLGIAAAAVILAAIIFGYDLLLSSHSASKSLSNLSAGMP